MLITGHAQLDLGLIMNISVCFHDFHDLFRIFLEKCAQSYVILSTRVCRKLRTVIFWAIDVQVYNGYM